jgi:hypothetical protein
MSLETQRNVAMLAPVLLGFVAGATSCQCVVPCGRFTDADKARVPVPTR